RAACADHARLYPQVDVPLACGQCDADYHDRPRDWSGADARLCPGAGAGGARRARRAAGHDAAVLWRAHRGPRLHVPGRAARAVCRHPGGGARVAAHHRILPRPAPKDLRPAPPGRARRPRLPHPARRPAKAGRPAPRPRLRVRRREEHGQGRGPRPHRPHRRARGRRGHGRCKVGVRDAPPVALPRGRLEL
ncbi:hypothetical protein H4R21_004272, partial [Coemansia helicoidea]